jgi:hypothetical protein
MDIENPETRVARGVAFLDAINPETASKQDHPNTNQGEIK